jgi:glycosyltransferase involved in cell wall biosynthesis
VPLVITIGELKVSKGQRDFVLASNEIVKASPDCRFVIAGKDNSIDQSFRRELKRLVRVLGHEDRFLWLDEMADVSPLLAAAELFVSPSHAGGFDSGILDAIEAGTPVVATETEAVKELIPDESSLVPVKDPLALAEKIAYLLGENDARRALNQRQREDAGRIFSLQRMVDATEKVYQKVLDR